MKKFFLLIFFSAIIFLVAEPVQAQTPACQPTSDPGEYFCTPAKNPLPGEPYDCKIANGGMTCYGIPEEYNSIGFAQGSITASSYSIQQGQSVTLTWTTAQSADCNISGTSVSPSGNRSVSPTTNTTYVLSCKSADQAGNPATLARDIGSVRISVGPPTNSSNTTPTTSPPPSPTNTNTNCPPNTQPGQLCYVPLEPFSGLEQAQSGTGNLRELIQGFFRLLINIGAFVAVTVLVIGGITYMVSEATVTKFVAKERIKAAFWGMAILAGAWLILNTINPQLLMFSERLVGPASGATEQARVGANNAITYLCYSNASKTSPPISSQIMTDAEAKTSAGRAKINDFTNQCPGLVDTRRGTLAR